jgi:hypothetical protein
VPVLELAGGGPACDREQDGVELLCGRLLDPHLPALALERQQVGTRERDEVADEKLGGARARRLDTDRADDGLP